MSPAEVSGEDDGGFIFFAAAEEGDVGQIGEEVEAEEILRVGEFGSFIFADLREDDAAGGGLAEGGEVAVQIPLGFGGNMGGLERSGRGQRNGEERGEKERCFHRKAYAMKAGKVTPGL